MKPHLFFDVFIEDSMPGLFKGGDRTRFLTESNIRNKSEVYKYRSKYEITKYTLESYSLLPWTSEIIRIECENPAQKVITNEIKQFFPKAKILNERSNTSAKYINALNSSGIPDDDWVFFSPNNDHPFIGYELDFIQNFYDDVDNDSKSIPDGLTSIYFSHFSETVNMLKPSQKRWGAYGDVYPKLIKETETFYLIKSNKLLLDSIMLFRMNNLINFFKSATPHKRLIRLEETNHYLKDGIHYIYIPKKELCAHFDGYTHIPNISNKIPPLFIPPGYFESNIKIKYGGSHYETGKVNINPNNDVFSFQNITGTDLKIKLDTIPLVWKDKISNIDIDCTFIEDKLEVTSFDLDKENPWRNEYRILIFFKSFRRFLKFKLQQLLKLNSK